MGEAGPGTLMAAVAAELERTRRALEELALDLCLDPVLVARHSASLQAFDGLGQVLGEIAQVLTGGGDEAALLDAVRLDALRERLMRACRTGGKAES